MREAASAVAEAAVDSAAVVLEAAASREPVWAFAVAPVWAFAAAPLAAVASTMRLAQGSAGAGPVGEVVLAGVGDPGGAPVGEVVLAGPGALAPGGPDGALVGVVVDGLDGEDGDGVGVGRLVPV
jgi:hypothetical protein